MVTTIPTGYTITSIKFVMNSTDNKVESFTATNGTVTNTDTKEWTYSPSTSNISAETFSVKASGGDVQISAVWVSFSDGVSDDVGNYESIYPVSAGSESPKVITFESSIATSNVTSLTTEGSGVNNKCVQVGNNQKVVITASKNIKYILFSWNKYAPSADSKWEANTGSYVKATYKWTPANSTTKSVTFTRKESNTAEISNIHIVYYPSCTKPAAPTALSCTAQTVNTLTFGWTKETNAVGYVAKLYSDSGCETEVDSKDLGDVNTVTFTGLSNSSTYYCKVQSKGNGTDYCEEGSVTSAANGTTETPSCGVVTAPTSLLVGATTANGASFTIIDDADAYNYELYISESNTEPESSATATHTSTEKTKDVTGLTSGTTYYAWVRSVCDADHKSAWTAANKSFKVRTNPTASFADATYIIGQGNLDMSPKFSSNSEGAVVYELKEATANAEVTSAGVFSATVAGEYVVVANQAGNSDYMPISKEATVTVLDSEISDIYIWKKNTSYGGDDKCISAPAANVDPNANAAYKELDFSSQTMTGMSAMGRPAHDNDEVTLTFAVKDAYNSLFAIKSLCVYGKLDEAEGAEISWDNGANWTAIAKYSESKRTFDAPTGVYPANFKIRFTAKEVSQETGGLWWRNALVTLEAKKTVTGTVVELNNVKVNGTAISGSELSSLLTNKTLDLATVYTTAPTVTFVKRTTVNYAGGWPADETDENIDVDATDATTNWSASQLINENNYTVTLAKPTVPSLITEATGFTLTSTKVAKDTETFTFSGMNLTSGNVTIALESAVAGMTVSPAEVTPTEGVITDQEVTITYKSVEDVAEANVNLVVYYDADTKIVLPLTYSSTAGIVDLTPISASTTWNWDHANSSTDAIESLDANEIVVFANYSGWVDAFKANSIAGKLQYVYRGNNYAQGHNLKFNTTVPGIVTVTFSNTSTKEVARAPRITDVNGSYAPTDEADGAKTADKKSYSHAVAAGDVLIEGFEMQEGTPANMLRFYEVRFVPTFSVTYKPNGGTGAEYIDDNATEVAEGTLFTAPASSAFVEWNTQADGNGDSYLPGAAVTADLELYAQWETSYTVTFDLQDHGDAIDPQNIVSGGKVVKPADPSADTWEFGGWYKESTCENEWDFATDVVTTTTTIFAKWTADPCPTPFSLSKVVLTSASDGTVTGYNGNEYAGEKVIGGLSSTETAEVDLSHEGAETGYKLNSGGSAIVFATLKKGTFQVGDRVVVTITKKQDAYKVEEVAQPILDIYYGTDKNDATFLTTLEGVSAAGTYTYRLTAADVTAIGTKKGIGVFRPSSGRTQNPYVYSVEIKGCREWAVSHQVTYDMMGHGTQVDPQSVPEGDLLTKPTVVEPEGWAFAGWYKENTLENEWDFTTDVMGTSDMTLYAKWEDETSAIKLIVDGATPGTKKINDEAYYTGSPLTTVEISEVETPCVKLAGGATAATAPYSADKNDNRVIAYCAQTTQTKIRVTAYSNTNSARPYTISFVEEGQTADQADDNNVIVNLPTDGTIHTTDWYTFNSDKNRTIYITIPGNASNYHFLQVKVIESGTPIKKAGDLGYSMNFNIGRPIGVKQTLHKNFEGFDFYANNDYKVLQSTSMVISNATNDYIKFHAAAPMTLAVTTENAASFYVTKAAKGTDNETLSTAGGISYIDLDEAADWYISPKDGEVKIQKIEFIAPKCAEPTITPMSNSDLCEGDAFEALTVSASVSDGGTRHYQWFKEAGETDEAVGTDAASYTPTADGQYYVIVTNQLADHSDNSKTSNTITVTHFASAAITTAPLNQRATVGNNVTLSVAATGKNVAYKWYTCDEDGSHEVALDPEQTGTSIEVTITAGLLQWYKVKVTSDCGNVEAMAKVEEFVPATPANVTESIVWDWKSTTAGFPTENTSIDFANTSVEELFADVDAAMPNNAEFRSDMLYGIGQRAWRKSDKDGECGFQGFQIRFHSDVAGLVRVYFRAPSSGQTSVVTIDGKPAGSRGNSWGWSEYVEVPAAPTGDGIVIAMTNGENGMTRIQKIEFLALEDRRADTWVKPGELGTVCLKNDAMVMGANIYALAGLDENGYLAFNQILNGELVAGKPYLFEATRSGDVSFYKTLNAGHADEADVTNGMHGTFSDKTFSPNTAESEGIYYFSGTHIWKVDDFSKTITVPAYRCYVDYDAVQAAGPAQAPAAGCRRVTLGVNGKNNATDVENLNASEAPVKLIIDGKMYILRGEKLFDATGRLVK